MKVSDRSDEFMIYFLLLPMAVMNIRCTSSGTTNSGIGKSTIEYAQNTGHLWSVAEVRLNADGSITLVDAEVSGYGGGLTMLDPKRERVESITLKPGQYCLLTDLHHASITYEFVRLDGCNILLRITDRFDARSFGDGVTKEKKAVIISPYKAAENPPHNSPTDAL